MKILHIINDLGNGGAENFLVELCNEQFKHNEVQILTYGDNDPTWLPFRKLDKRLKLITCGTFSFRNTKIWKKLNKVLKEYNPDIIHCHLPMSLYPFYVLRNKKYKLFYTFHSTPKYDSTTSSELMNKFIRKINKFMFKNHKITPILTSNDQLEEFKELYGECDYKKINISIADNPVTNKYNSVVSELEKYKSDKFKHIFIHIARLTQAKNYELIVEIANYLNKKNIPIAILCIISNRLEEQEYYEKLFKNKPDNLILLDIKDNVQDYLAATDAFILTSHNEGTPRVMIEALYKGLPVLTTKVGVAEDFIFEGKNGYISRNFTLDGFVEIINKYINTNFDKDKIKEFNKTTKLFETFSPESCVKKHNEIFENIIDNKK